MNEDHIHLAGPQGGCWHGDIVAHLLAYAGDMQPVITRVDLGRREVPYQEGWDLQRVVHGDVVAGRRLPTVLLLEHEHVYTAGTRTEPADLPPPHEPLVRVDRGGRITWHGPGQVVAYPIVRLPNPMDVVAYVRRLEDALMATCARWDIDTARVPGRSGVWVVDSVGQDRKIAAIGVRVSRGVAMHGVALNVNNELAKFGRIVPCGISDAGVTSMKAEGAALPPVDAVSAVADVLAEQLGQVLDWE